MTLAVGVQRSGIALGLPRRYHLQAPGPSLVRWGRAARPSPKSIAAPPKRLGTVAVLARLVARAPMSRSVPAFSAAALVCATSGGGEDDKGGSGSEWQWSAPPPVGSADRGTHGGIPFLLSAVTELSSAASFPSSTCISDERFLGRRPRRLLRFCGGAELSGCWPAGSRASEAEGGGALAAWRRHAEASLVRASACRKSRAASRNCKRQRDSAYVFEAPNIKPLDECADSDDARHAST